MCQDWNSAEGFKLKINFRKYQTKLHISVVIAKEHFKPIIFYVFELTFYKFSNGLKHSSYSLLPYHPKLQIESNISFLFFAFLFLLRDYQFRYLRNIGDFVNFWPDEPGDSVVAGDVADGDVDLGVGEQLRDALVHRADNQHVRSLKLKISD